MELQKYIIELDELKKQKDKLVEIIDKNIDKICNYDNLEKEIVELKKEIVELKNEDNIKLQNNNKLIDALETSNNKLIENIEHQIIEINKNNIDIIEKQTNKLTIYYYLILIVQFIIFFNIIK